MFEWPSGRPESRFLELAPPVELMNACFSKGVVRKSSLIAAFYSESKSFMLVIAKKGGSQHTMHGPSLLCHLH